MNTTNQIGEDDVMNFIIEDFPHVKAVHIWQGNEIVFQELKNYKENDLFPVGCIFKSFLSALVGMAIHEGKIGSITDRITDYYTEYSYASEWNQLTISHALSKTTGLSWPAMGETIPKNMSEVFDLSFACEPGTEFLYTRSADYCLFIRRYLWNVNH